jgi:dihydrofolate reductase
MQTRLSIIVAMARNAPSASTTPCRGAAEDSSTSNPTMGHHMIRGRKTFDSIGKPLPGRTTVVVTRNSELKIEGCIVTHSLDQAIAACAGDDEIFVVGGAELYAQALPLADRLYLTEVQQNVDGDAHFPLLDLKQWQETAREARNRNPQPLALLCHLLRRYRRI